MVLGFCARKNLVNRVTYANLFTEALVTEFIGASKFMLLKSLDTSGISRGNGAHPSAILFIDRVHDEAADRGRSHYVDRFQLHQRGDRLG